jgi:hypothetical protein
LLDPIAVERAESEINRYIEKRADYRNQANEEARREKAVEQRRLEALHFENKTLWVHHHFSLAEEHAKLSAEHARRAQALLAGPGVSDG